LGHGFGPTSLGDDVDLCWDDSDDGDGWETASRMYDDDDGRADACSRARVVGSIMAHAVMYHAETGGGGDG